MSFILDALKKSENERARQNGPALLEARVIPPRRGPPAWAIVVGIVLVANLALLVYVLTRAPQPAAPSVTAPASAPAAPAVPPTANVPPAQPAIVLPTPAPPPVPAPAPSLPPPRAEVVNPADYAPARPAGSVPRASASTAAGASGAIDTSLPTAADLLARGTGLPALNLALHVFDEQPQNRYVIVNSQRLREGETSNEGVRVERIAPEGVLMSWRGQRFRLLPGG